MSMLKIFKDGNSLHPDTLPPKLLFRDKEIRTLASNFRIFFDKRHAVPSKNLSTVVLLLGGPGQGKTTMAKMTTNHIVELAKQKNARLISSYQNCWRSRTLIGVLTNVFDELGLETSKRGISLDEQIAGQLLPFLEEEDLHLLLILDEINRLKGDEINSLFSLIELTHRISMIFISRPTEWQILMTPDLNQKITETLWLYPYTADELYKILEFRISLALQPTTYDTDTISLICDLIKNDQNLRLGLEIIFRAAKIAEKNNSDFLNPDFIREAKSLTFPELRSEIIQELKIHELLILLGIGRRLQNKNFSTLSIKDTYRFYKSACIEYFEEAKKISSFRTYIKNLHKLGLINQIIAPTGRGKRGVKARISIPDVPVDIIVERVEEQIEKFYN